MDLADLAIKHDQEWGVQWELNGIPSQQYVNILVCVWIGYTPCDSNLGLPILDNPHSNIWQLAHHNIGYQNQTTQIWGVPHFVPDQENNLWILYLRKTPGRRHSITIQMLDIDNFLYNSIYIYTRMEYVYIYIYI